MDKRSGKRQLAARLTEEQWNLFQAAREAPHFHGPWRRQPTVAETLTVLAASICHEADQGGHNDWHLRCQAAPVAWERHCPLATCTWRWAAG